MDATALRKWVLKALESGAVGTIGDIRGMTAGAGSTALKEIEAILFDLEDDGFVVCNAGTWRSTTHGAHLSGTGDERGAQRRALVFLPSLRPSTFLHLSYWEGTGSFRLRRYEPGQPVEFVDVPEAHNNVVELRKLHPIAREHDCPVAEARPVDQVEFWAREIAKLNKELVGR